MERIYFNLLNNWFENNPLGMFIFGLICYAIIKFITHGIPWLIKWRTGEREKDKFEKRQSRDKIIKITDTMEYVEKHLRDINGSINKHHNDRTIHYKADEVMTPNKCYLLHSEIKEEVKNFDKKMDSNTIRIFEKLDNLTEKFYEFKGKQNAS